MARALRIAFLVLAAAVAAAAGDAAGDGTRLRGSHEPAASSPEALVNATALPANATEPPVNATELEWLGGDAAGYTEAALPGGWGEAADAVAPGNFTGALAAEGPLLKSATFPGSCAAYGCHSRFHAMYNCQCFSGCGNNCCSDFQAKCSGPQSKQNLRVLYHQTSPEAGALILKNGFRPGSQGWCGGGIYFATTPQETETKAIGPDSHKGFMIEATVDLGRVKEMTSTCDRTMTGVKLFASNFDSVTFNPGDGVEYVVYSPSRVLSVRKA